jgi:hypothetical protein
VNISPIQCLLVRRCPINDKQKRELRKLKRVIKRAGSKHRRRELKRDLRERPEDAAHSEENLGRNRSNTLNRLDQDPTRRRKDEEIGGHDPGEAHHAPDK